eukprot:4293255-Amphidinium_carterae.1
MRDDRFNRMVDHVLGLYLGSQPLDTILTERCSVVTYQSNLAAECSKAMTLRAELVMFIDYLVTPPCLGASCAQCITPKMYQHLRDLTVATQFRSTFFACYFVCVKGVNIPYIENDSCPTDDPNKVRKKHSEQQRTNANRHVE